METPQIKLVKTYFERFFAGQKEEAFELLTDDVHWIVRGSDNVPTVGVRRGKAEVSEFFLKFHQVMEPQEFRIDHYFGEGSLVFVIGSFTHRIKSNQRQVSSDFMIRFEIKDHKIASYKILEDSYALYLAFK